MKKFFLMVIAAMMATLSVSAQDEKNEVGVFYGTWSASDVLSTYTSAFAAACGDQSSWWGPVGVEYYYHLTPCVAVGGVAEYAACKAEDKKTQEKDLSESFITVMPSVKFNWLRKKSFGLYSSLSGGVMFASISVDGAAKNADKDAKDETLTMFMFQITPLGVEFGGNFRGFIEAGIGEKGVFCAGLRYKF